MDSPPVICRRGDAETAATLDSRGWLDPGSLPVVVQLGATGRSARTIATARSLCEYLAQRFGATPTVLDDAGSDAEWAPYARRDMRHEETFRIASPVIASGIAVPRLWFESFFLITVAAITPSSAGRVSCVLDAQADPLRAAGNRAAPHALAYDAHRLAPSDLAIACTALPGGDWLVAASTSDVQLEQAIVRAAAHDGTSSFISGIARHELVPVHSTIEGEMPDLRHCAGARWTAQLHGARARASSSWRGMTHDIHMISRNLHKIPAFVRRRLAAASRKA